MKPLKPHEEAWYEQGGDVFVQTGPERSGDDHLVMYGDNRGPRKALIAVAPQLARSLVACGEVIDGVWHTGACINADDPHGKCTQGCIEARGALAKAGIL